MVASSTQVKRASLTRVFAASPEEPESTPVAEPAAAVAEEVCLCVCCGCPDTLCEAPRATHCMI